MQASTAGQLLHVEAYPALHGGCAALLALWDGAALSCQQAPEGFSKAADPAAAHCIHTSKCSLGSALRAVRSSSVRSRQKVSLHLQAK